MKADGLSLDDKRNMLLTEEQFDKCFDAPEEAAEFESALQDDEISSKIISWKDPANYFDHR